MDLSQPVKREDHLLPLPMCLERRCYRSTLGNAPLLSPQTEGLGRANNHGGFFWCSCVVLAQNSFDRAWTSLCRSNSGALTCLNCCVSGVALLAGRTKADAVSSGNSAGTQRPSEATAPFWPQNTQNT